MIYRLFYISNVSPFFKQDTLVEMCSGFADKNRKKGLGGALVFNGTNFGQVLEGEKSVVMELSERIKLDVRHTSYQIITAREVEDRYYKDWGMNLVHGFDFSALEQAMQN